VGEIVALEVYDTESSEWYKFNSIQRFRHSVWTVDNLVYVHGGFEHETPNIPINLIAKIDTSILLKNLDHLLAKIKPLDPNKPVKQNTNKVIQKNIQNPNMYNIGQEKEFRLSNQAHIAVSYQANGQE